MNLKILLPIIVVILFVTQNFGDAFIIHFTEKHRNETGPVEDRNFLRCKCNHQTRTAKLSKAGKEKVLQNIRNKTFCGRNETKICKWLKECNSCIVEMEKCTAFPGPGSGYDCSKKTFEMTDNYFISTNPNNGSSGERRRKPRHAETCMYPNGMQTSSLSFLKYPSSIWVKQKCIFGHTFKDGISREMRCEYSEDKWKPNGFEECQPFIDCTITMITTGSSKCATGTIESAPYCNISCDRYEDKPAVPENTYECQIYGAWKPKLPYCAKAGSDIELVPAPNIKLHAIEEKPILGKLKKPPRVYRKP